LSPFIAVELMKRHRLPELPSVVFNAPAASDGTVVGGTDVRAACGVGDDVPLLVYSGGVTPARGIDVVVKALALLPDVHLAVVCVPGVRTKPVEKLVATALALGVRDRMHLLDPVGPEQVTTSGAPPTSVHPLPGGIPNHHGAANVFEYLQAGLPLVVSDAKALVALTRTTSASRRRATRPARRDGRRVARATYAAEVAHQRDEHPTWEAGADAGRRLQPPARHVARRPRRAVRREAASFAAARTTASCLVSARAPAGRLGVAKAAERYLDGVTCEVLGREGHLRLPQRRLRRPADFARARVAARVQRARHVDRDPRADGGRASRHRHAARRDFSGAAVRALGITVGPVFHGSEIPTSPPRRGPRLVAVPPLERRLTERLQQKHDELALLPPRSTGRFAPRPTCSTICRTPTGSAGRRHHI
jgi:hypothetical protein